MKVINWFLIAQFIISAGCPSKGVANQHAEFEKVIERFNKAFQEGKTAEIEKFISDDYAHTNGSSASITKTKWLEYVKNRESKIKSGELKIIDYRLIDREIKFLGDIAVLTGRVIVKSVNNNEEIQTEFRVTNVWRKESEGWKRIAFQDSKIER